MGGKKKIKISADRITVKIRDEEQRPSKAWAEIASGIAGCEDGEQDANWLIVDRLDVMAKPSY